jgi:hypothetical protein
MAVTTQAPKYTQELLDATEKTLRAHDLRCKPGIGLETVLDTLTSNQCEVAQAYGQLTINQHGAPIHTPVALEGLAKQRAELFYPRELGAVTARDQMDTKAKMKMLSEPGGFERFEKLPATTTTSTVVVLDQSRLTKSQWLSLDLPTRAELSGRWGAGAVAQIMARK